MAFFSFRIYFLVQINSRPIMSIVFAIRLRIDDIIYTPSHIVKIKINQNFKTKGIFDRQQVKDSGMIPVLAKSWPFFTSERFWHDAWIFHLYYRPMLYIFGNDRVVPPPTHLFSWLILFFHLFDRISFFFYLVLEVILWLQVK